MSEEKNVNMNESEFLKKVEKAAKKGATKGSIQQVIIQALPTILVLLLIAGLIIPKINNLHEGLKGFFRFDTPVENHDSTISNAGIFGYTATDFEEAVLGDSSKLKKLEIFEQEISDVATITDTGFLNWGVFTKNQLITYNGKVVYTVDLSNLKASDLSFNEEEKIVTLKIPHAKQEPINIPEEDIQFGDTNKGLLAFGDIKMTAEQASQIQADVRKKMEDKLVEQKTLETADRFAKLSVWEIYSPIIKGVGKDVSLEVEFK